MNRLLLLLAFAYGCSGATEVRVRMNGAFSSEGTEALLVETRYRTTAPGEPWFHAPSASDWTTVFLRADQELRDVQELARFDDRSQGQGGGIQSGALYWLAAHGRAVAIEYHEAVLFDLRTETLTVLDLPREVRDSIFVRSELDLSDYASPLAAVPAPDESRIAVFYTASYLGPGGFVDVRFVHALAFFDVDGRFERAMELSPWSDTEEDLVLSFPTPSPLPPNPDPPDFQEWGMVPGLYPQRFVWTRDASAVVVVDVQRDESGAIINGLAMQVDARSGTMTPVTRVPSRAVPTRGGPVRPDGTHLLLRFVEGHPNETNLALHPTTDWIGFDEIEEIELRDASYAR